MSEHLVEVCLGDPAALKLRLDQLAAEGAEIVSVFWQANRLESDQIAAFEGGGSFVIVARQVGDRVLRERGDLTRAELDAPMV
jgi:hypothetical protein